MVKIFGGLLFGFMVGMTYGLFAAVEASDSVLVKLVAVIKGVILG